MNVFTLAGRSLLPPLRLRSTVQRQPTQLLKRPSSTKPPSASSTSKPVEDAPKQSSIPGPSWLWLEPLAAPFKAYGRAQARSPYITQISSSLTIYWLGDLSAQLVSASPSSSDDDHHIYEPIRGVRALIIGGISSIPSYHWFLFLGRHFNYPSHALSICVKIVVNQMVFTPLFNTYFFGMQSLLSGSTFEEAKRRVVDTVPISWRNSWKVWPIVTAFSFTFVKPQFRSVVAGVVAIGWQTYLSWLNMVAAKREETGGMSAAMREGGVIGKVEEGKAKGKV